MNKILKLLSVVIVIMGTQSLNAKDYEITLASDPDGAQVYLNGLIVAQTTPAILKIDKKNIDKNLMFKFEKKGYESRTVIISFDKKEIKKNPVVYCNLERSPEPIPTPSPVIQQQDPSIPKGQANARVSRDNPGQTSMEKIIIRWYFDSEPRGARVYYRVISNVPEEVKNSNEAYLTTTPLEETKGFNIPGLTYDNSRNVTIEIKVTKKGYEDQIKRYNVRQALDQQEISGFFDLVPKESSEE